MRRGVTLIELLFVLMILGILAAIGFGTYTANAAQAKAERTRAIIAKIDQYVTAKWESYRTRAVPIKLPAGTDPVTAAQMRLVALRELQRCELPDRIADIQTLPTSIAMPSLQRSYRRSMSMWSNQHEGAECLYLILANMRDGEDSALSFFSPQEVGDYDSDGMKEILDGFGRPIEFVRWPAGYIQEDGPVTTQTKDETKAPDYFDPLKVDPRWRDADTTFQPYALRPLVYSPGPDGDYHISAGTATTNDPYANWNATPMVGSPTTDGWQDNITNHYSE